MSGDFPSLKEIERMHAENRREVEAHEAERRKREAAKQRELERRAKVVAEARKRLKKADVTPKVDPSKVKAVPPKSAPPPAVAGISRMRQPRRSLTPDTVAVLAKGHTKITPGSMRDKVLAFLRDHPTHSASIGDISLRVKFDAKPVIAKLHEAGWVTL